MSFNHFDKLSKLHRLSVENINSDNPNMLFNSAQEMRKLAEKVNYDNNPFILFKAKIIDGISDAANHGKFKFEIPWPNDVAQVMVPSIDKDLQDAGYTVNFEPAYNSPITHIVISWS